MNHERWLENSIKVYYTYKYPKIFLENFSFQILTKSSLKKWHSCLTAHKDDLKETSAFMKWTIVRTYDFRVSDKTKLPKQNLKMSVTFLL